MTRRNRGIQQREEKVQAPPSDTVASSPLLEEAAADPGDLQPPAPDLQPPVPSRQPAEGFPVVGIGASAGGLAAFEAFFSGMPADTDPGMAFVLVQHLAPDYKSILSDLIGRCTRMEVFEVTDGMMVQPNCVYVIPPGRNMALLNGMLQLLEPSAPRGQRLPIDFLFRSLAQDQRERAIGIVLSGTGSDGTLGLRAIKGEGGMVMAQNPDSAEYDGMPRSAIATGLVDYELPPAEMAAQLITYAAHPLRQAPRTPAPPENARWRRSSSCCAPRPATTFRNTSRAWSGDLVHRRGDGTERVAEASISPVRDADRTVTGFVALERDVTAERALAVERERLVAAVEQTSDSVIITDLAGTIEYVNPAFERVSGYRRDEAIGQNPRMLKSGRQSAAFYRALWRRLTRGKTWTGTLINRRKDGSLYEEDATISPIRRAGGEITGHVAVQRDVTALRAAESGLAREFRERAEVAAALARLQPRGSAEATAAVICDELLGLPGIDAAVIVNFLDPQRAVPLAVSGPDGLPVAPGRPLPATRARYLYERAGRGPWAEAWRPRRADGAYGQTMAELGIRAVAYAPIRNGEDLLGVVAVGTRDEAYVRHLIDRLPAVGEFAATARALLSGQLERGHRDELARERVRRSLMEGGLRTVFQPIVDLASAEPVGYEALTRFADGTPPDRMIAEAHSVGLGLELEVACLAAALDAAEDLPQDAWLSLNASPDVILHSTELVALLADRSRQIVIEVTEHVEIDDYAAVRAAVAALRPTVSLAVDDAGAGFASLRHVVELAPRFLKLDISLVRHVDRDLTRQAMIAGLSHFAKRAGCQVIAEGIEDPAELDMLRELGVPFGQGYLLGRPEAVSRPTDEA